MPNSSIVTISGLIKIQGLFLRRETFNMYIPIELIQFKHFSSKMMFFKMIFFTLLGIFQVMKLLFLNFPFEKMKFLNPRILKLFLVMKLLWIILNFAQEDFGHQGNNYCDILESYVTTFCQFFLQPLSWSSLCWWSSSDSNFVCWKELVSHILYPKNLF